MATTPRPRQSALAALLLLNLAILPCVNADTLNAGVHTNEIRQLSGANCSTQPQYCRQHWLSLTQNHFSDNMDLLGYQSKSASSSELKSDSHSRLTLGRHLGDWNSELMISVFKRTGRVHRKTEPTEVKGEQQGYSLGIKKTILNNALAISGWVEQADFEKHRFYEYRLQNILLGRDVILRDPKSLEPLPVISLASRTQSLAFSISASEHSAFNGRLTAQNWIGYRLTKIDSQTDSVLFGVSDPAFLNSQVKGVRVRDLIAKLKNTMPQNSSWTEHLLSFGVKAEHQPQGPWSLHTSASLHYVNRVDYKKGNNEDEKQHNIELNLRLAREFGNISGFIGVTAFSNYLNGVSPGIYNRRTAHVFDDPFAYLNAGISVRF